MPTDASFRFSTYLALALACVALGYAEFEMLPEVAAFGVLAVIGLGVLYFLESRVAFLSIPAANRLGMVIGLVYLFIVVEWLLATGVTLLGVFDLWADFRRLNPRPVEED